MVVVRVAVGMLGLAALVWGGVLAIELPEQVSVATWFVAGPLAHDLLIAPVVAALGVLVARTLTPAWRAPVATGGTLTGVLIVLAIPLLWRSGGPVNPGLHDRDYPVGLAAALALIWLAVLATGMVRARKIQR
jgi:hypothetical protein